MIISTSACFVTIDEQIWIASCCVQAAMFCNLLQLSTCTVHGHCVSCMHQSAYFCLCCPLNQLSCDFSSNMALLRTHQQCKHNLSVSQLFQTASVQAKYTRVEQLGTAVKQWSYIYVCQLASNQELLADKSSCQSSCQLQSTDSCDVFFLSIMQPALLRRQRKGHEHTIPREWNKKNMLVANACTSADIQDGMLR